MTLSRAKHLPRVPRERCTVEGNEHQTGFGARDQQRCIVQAKPGSVPPPCDVDDRKITSQSPASRNESVRCVFVSQ